MEINVIDNVLPTDIANSIESVILSSWFPWYLSKGIDYDNDGKFQFVHNFYKDFNWVSYEQELVSPILKILNPKKIIKIKANLTLKSNFLDNSSLYHIDVDNDNAITAIYYVNDNDGKTTFKGIDTVECKKNRLVLFPSQILHTGKPHTNNIFGGKCVINFNFIPEEKNANI